MRRVLLDTDIGGDIDDAICLAYLLAQPRCDLLGITTVGGEPERRARIASALCAAAGKRVPVCPGAAEPLVVEQRQPHAHQEARLGAWRHDTEFPAGEAVAFLRRTIRARPGEVTLLGIGPMTNIAMLFADDPDIPGLLAGLVLMAGWFGDRPDHADVGDWNVLCDPHAADIVYGARVAVHRSIPFDITQRASVPVSEFRSRFGAGPLALIRDLADGDLAEDVTFHDPLAAATMFDDRICGFRRGSVQVALDDDETLGLTLWTAGGSEHEVACDVGVARFFDHCFSVLDGRAEVRS